MKIWFIEYRLKNVEMVWRIFEGSAWEELGGIFYSLESAEKGLEIMLRNSSDNDEIYRISCYRRIFEGEEKCSAGLSE